MDPRGNVEVVTFAIPEPFRFTVPKTVLPAVNVTVPLGVVVDEVTVAVKVTLCPKSEGFLDEVIVVVVTDWLTT